MNLIARFESFIERLMERSFTRATGSHPQPVEIGKRLARAMEESQSVGTNGVLVSHQYAVFLSAPDYGYYEEQRNVISRDLEYHLRRTARQRAFYMVTNPAVTIHRDPHLPPGDYRVEIPEQAVKARGQTEFQHTAVMPRMDGPIVSSPSTPNVVWNGTPYAVLRSPTRLGRLPDNDIVLDDRRVSRHHAEVILQGSRWVLRDTKSTNGTSVNGKIVREAMLKPGDKISLGGLEVKWEQ